MLDRMVVAYDRGLLVPFVGAGMSEPACHLWGDFVARLEIQAACGSKGDLVHRAARAVRKLRFGSGTTLAEAVTSALSDGPMDPPPQTKALAQIYWPLVLTTNYDDLYIAAAHEAHVRSRPRLRTGEKREPPVLLLGRKPADCQRVLVSLRQPDVPLMWTLQGLVGGQANPLQHQVQVNPGRASYRDHIATEERGYFDEQWQPLKNELVVGHAEYRRVALASAPFRRAFAEVYRSRSLLFLGSGLTDAYFLELFSEIVELYGPSPHPHYAFLPTDRYDLDFLRQYFGIWVSPLRHYRELPDRLTELKERIDGPRDRQAVWHVSRTSNLSVVDSSEENALRILRRELPKDPADGECVAFSAGERSGEPRLSHVGKEVLHDLGLGHEESAFERLEVLESEDLPLWRHRGDPRFLAVTARLDPWTELGARIRPTDPEKRPIGKDRPAEGEGRIGRDIRIVSLAAQELMEAARSLGYRRVHSMLLAAGTLRTMAQSHALLQMARGWAKWRSRLGDPQPDLTIYLTPWEQSDILHDLDAGRIHLVENLAPTVVEFWLEIHKLERADASTAEPSEQTEVERYLQVEGSGRALREVLADFDIEGDDWRLGLLPTPCLKWANWTLGGAEAWKRHFGHELSLETFGIIPGSTLKVWEPRSQGRTGASRTAIK